MNLFRKRDYPFVAAALPPLQMGMKPELSYQGLMQLIQDNFAPSDKEKVMVLLSYWDILNMECLWQGEELYPFGNFDSVELEELLQTGISLPDYIYSFLLQYENRKDRLTYFPRLMSDYFRFEIPRVSGFLQEYLTFEKECRLVLTALRAKELHRDILKELQFEDPSETLVVDILAQKDAKSYEPPSEWIPLKTIYETYREKPMELFSALASFRFEAIQEMLGIDLTSTDRILGYLARLIQVEIIERLDEKRGAEMIDQISRDR